MLICHFFYLVESLQNNFQTLLFAKCWQTIISKTITEKNQKPKYIYIESYILSILLDGAETFMLIKISKLNITSVEIKYQKSSWEDQ